MQTIRTYGAAFLTIGALVTAMAAVAAAAPAPANFEPGSVSFPSASDGFVLGEVPCGTADCPSMLKTTNGGRTWTTVGVPNTAYLEPSEQQPETINQVMFANSNDGWAFGPALWATTNGGASWHMETVGGPVLAMMSAGGNAYAVVGSCYQSSSKCAQPTDKVEKTAVGPGIWAPIPGLKGVGTTTYLATTGSTVFIALWSKLNGPAVIWQSSNGTSWQHHAEACYQPSQAVDLAGLAAATSTTVYELCAGNPGAGQEEKYVEASTNGGASAHLAGRLSLGGLAGTFAAATTGDIAVGAASGASFIYHSGNGGKSWGTTTFNDGGAGLSDLQFAGAALGAVVEGRPGLGGSDRLWLSRNGGGSWAAAQF